MNHRASTNPALIALVLMNLVCLAFISFREPAAAASASPADGVLRGRALEIVDDRGRVRASIAIHPAARQADGSTYPETVLLRLITSKGRPIVKISSLADGSAMPLTDAEGDAYIQLLSRRDDPHIAIVDRAGRTVSKLP